MTVATIEQFYDHHIKPLSVNERLQLASIITQQLAEKNISVEPAEKPKHSIMELHGLGAEIWQGIDAQEYVDKLREEWSHRYTHTRCVANCLSAVR